MGWDFWLATRRLTFFYPTHYIIYATYYMLCIYFIEWLWGLLGCFPGENYIFPRRKNSLYFYKLFRWKGLLTSFSASTPTSFVNVQIWTVCNSTLGNKFLPIVFLFLPMTFKLNGLWAPQVSRLSWQVTEIMFVIEFSWFLNVWKTIDIFYDVLHVM